MSQSPWELPPDERIAESFKSPYDPDGEYLSAVISAVANEMAEFETALAEVNKAKFVDTAQGQQLDKLASLVQLERRTGESDSTFRLRIKVEFLVQFASGTNPDLLSIISTLLDADPRLIEILEPVDDDGPSVVIGVPVDSFGRIKVGGDVFEESLQRVTAGGVRLGTFIDIGEFNVSALYGSTVSTDLGIRGDLYGGDSFDGAGAFGAQSDTDVTGQTAIQYPIRLIANFSGTTTTKQGFGESAFGAGAFDGESDDADVFGQTNIAFETAIAYASAFSTTIVEGDFAGVDSFDGQGAFGAGDSDSVLNQTTLAYSTLLSVDPTANQTEHQGFGESAFGAGAFDGSSDDADVFGATAADVFGIVSDYAEANSTEVEAGDFAGSDMFDGAGAFGAGDSDSVRTTTAISYTIIAAYAAATSTTEHEGFGNSAFGAGNFDGSPDDGDTEGTTPADGYPVILSNTIANTEIRDGFGGDSFDGAGAFGAGADDTVSDTTGISYPISLLYGEVTSVEANAGDFAGTDTFDGAGAFGAGDSNTPRTTTAISLTIAAVYAAASSTTEHEGFGSSAFGAGAFDGDVDVSVVGGTTAAGATTLTLVWASSTNKTAVSDGFGSDSFDGSGTFS